MRSLGSSAPTWRANPARLTGGKAPAKHEVARAEKELEHVTRRHVEVIDDLLKHKENELLEV